MVSEVSAARSQLAAVRRQARADTEKAAAAADHKTREYVDKFREQVRKTAAGGRLCVQGCRSIRLCSDGARGLLGNTRSAYHMQPGQTSAAAGQHECVLFCPMGTAPMPDS